MSGLRPSQGLSPGRSSRKRWIKSVIFFCLYYSGLEWLLARLIRADGTAILMYHGVCEHPPIPAHINFHLEPAIFDRQMRDLKRRYRIVPLADVVTTLARGERLKKAVVLTFDDGYKNNARYAAPVLRRLGLPATIFVATAYVESEDWMPLNEIYWRWSLGELSSEKMQHLRQQVRRRPWADVRGEIEELRRRPHPVRDAAAEGFAMLNWDEIQHLGRDGVDFGSHTHSHCNMAIESASQQRSELLLSKRLLEDRLSRSVRLFAYPYGHLEHMSDTSRQNVLDAGYECAVSATYGLVTSRSDRFCLPRLGYDRRIWMFTGEILYHFLCLAVRNAWLKLAGRTPVQR